MSLTIGKIPTRLNVGLMLFASCFVSYMLRVNMSINILAMVHHSEVEVLGDDNITAIVEPNVSKIHESTRASNSFFGLFMIAIIEFHVYLNTMTTYQANSFCFFYDI